MPGFKTIVLPAITIVTVVAAVVIGAGLLAPKTAATPTVDTPLPLAVTAIRADMLDSYDVQEQYSGLIRASRLSSLGFERAGLLVEVLADEGDWVEEGTPLARLDIRRLKSQQAVLNAQVANFRAGIADAQADTDLQSATTQRHRKLSKSGQISQQSLEVSIASLKRAKAQQLAAQARLQQINAELNALNVAIDLSELRAPYSGRISKRMADEGVSLSAGQPLLTLVESGNAEVHVGIPQKALPDLVLNQRYSFRIDGQMIAGELTKLRPEVDSRTRTVNAIFNLLSADSLYREGEIAQLSLTRKIESRGLWLPISALAEGRRGLWTAYAIADTASGDLLETRALQLVHTEASRVFVKGTVQQGERLVSSGLHRLVPGQRVRVSGEQQ